MPINREKIINSIKPTAGAIKVAQIVFKFLLTSRAGTHQPPNLAQLIVPSAVGVLNS